MPVLVALSFLFLAVLCTTTPCRVVAPCHIRLCARVCLLGSSVSRSGVSAHSQSGGSALRGLSLVWGVRAETRGSIAPTWGVSLGGCCLASMCAVGTIWQFSHPFGAAMIYTAYVEILYLNIFHTGGTMRYIYFTLTPTSRRSGVLYSFPVPCAWDSWFTLVFVLDLRNTWPPFCGDTRYNRWDLPGPYLSNRGSGAPVTGAAGGCVRTLCGVALFALVLCCPHCLRHTTGTMARTRVHAHTQNRSCPHGSCGAGSRAFWNMPA